VSGGLSQIRIASDSRFEPTIGNEANFLLSYDGSGHLIQLDKVVGHFTYRKTLTWVGDNLTQISEWIKL
jgi:hypothetical protein